MSRVTKVAATGTAAGMFVYILAAISAGLLCELRHEGEDDRPEDDIDDFAFDQLSFADH